MPVKSQQRITRQQARSLLEDLANFPSFLECRAEDGSPLQVAQYRTRARALARRFPQVFSELQGMIGDREEDFLLKAMIGLGEHIRQVWREADLRADWIIHELRRLWQRLFLKARQRLAPGERLEEFIPTEHQKRVIAQSEILLKKSERYVFWGWWPDNMPPLTPFHQVMIHFQRALPQARFCANSDCKNPYFFSYKRRKSCSARCAIVDKAEYKRQWWAKIGKRRRQRRQVLNRQKSQRRLKP